MADPLAVRYATIAGVRDLLSRGYTELVEDDEQAGPTDDDTAAALPDSSLARRIRAAANQVDTALAPYYDVPFTEGAEPGVIEDLTEAIAAYLADLTHRQAEDIEPNDPVRIRYQWALDQLAAIGRGDVELVGVTRKSSPWSGHGTAGPARNQIDGRLFTPQSFGLQTGRDCGWGLR